MPSSIPTPGTTPQSRILLIDMLRGMALLAILLVHSHDHFNCYVYPEHQSDFMTLLNQAAGWFNTLFLGGKAFMLFSFLFGVSFFIQMDRARARGVDFRLRFAWRLVLLFLIGVVHSFIYDGDILTLFAIQGLLIIPLYKLNIKYLFLIGLACILGLPLLTALGKWALDTQYLFTYYWENAGGDRNEVFLNGSFRDVAKWNILYGQSSKWKYVVESGRIGQTLGLFILGLAVGKMRFFEHYSNHIGIIKKITVSACCSWLVCLTICSLSDNIVCDLFFKVIGNLSYVAALILVITLSFDKPFIQKIAAYITPVGKVTLSAYIGQSVFFTFLFYGWGLGLSPAIGPFVSMMLGLGFFLIQALIGKWWLNYYSYGPVEWAWRSGTYMKPQPFRKSR